MYSVIIPVFNKKKHLFRSINSVLRQTFSEFELILVDDGSTDGSAEILKVFTDDRIRLFTRNSPGQGGYAARNLGIKKAQYEWIAFLDADDEWTLDRLVKLDNLRKRFPDEKILSSGWKEFYTADHIDLDPYSQKYGNSLSHTYDIHTLLLDKQPIWTSVAVVKKALLLEVNGFDESWKRGADLELWLRLLLTGAKGVWLNEVTATYFKDSCNMVTKNHEFIDSPVFPTIKTALKYERSKRLLVALKKFNNRINYGVTKSLLVKNKAYRKVFLKNFLFDFRTMNKVYLASLVLFFIPKKLSHKLIKKSIL